MLDHPIITIGNNSKFFYYFFLVTYKKKTQHMPGPSWATSILINEVIEVRLVVVGSLVPTLLEQLE